MKLLAIDTSCDDTSVAVTEAYRVLSSVISSQVRYHRKFGGVVPMLAARVHAERIENIVSLALQRAHCSWKDIDGIAVTYGPGLAPALQVGIAYAKKASAERNVPLYPVNHMAGHFASCFAISGSQVLKPLQLPSLALLVSGNHTELVDVKKFGDFTILGQTLDDAAGEAFDKAGRMLGLGYPGGKVLAHLAETGKAGSYALPVPMRNSKDLNFSYSGLKNAVRLVIEKRWAEGGVTRADVSDIAASFEDVAIQHIVEKCKKALQIHGPYKELLVGGGVAANKVLRVRLRKLAKEFGMTVRFPANLKLCCDNGAMIGVAAWMGIEIGQKPADPESVDRIPYLSLEDPIFTGK
jgi:N6-L-threonylcarbamoyladenine synthase